MICETSRCALILERFVIICKKNFKLTLHLSQNIKVLKLASEFLYKFKVKLQHFFQGLNFVS